MLILMENSTSPGFKLPRHFAIWAVILCVTFFIGVESLSAYSTSYFGEGNKTLLSSALFMVFSVAILLGLLWDNKRLLYTTGILEFIILFLPLLVFSSSSPFIPYSTTLSFLFSLPVLWTLLPIGLFYLTDKEKYRKKVLKTLFLLAVVTIVVWLFMGPCQTTCYASEEMIGGMYALYNSYSCIDWGCVLLSIFAWTTLLAIWTYVERRLSAPSKGKKPAPSFIKKNLPEILLAIAIIALIIAGFLMNRPDDYYEYYPVCGDGYCDWEETSLNCPEDCYCGNGWCEYTENRTSCPEDCEFCGDGYCDDFYGETYENCPEDCPQ